MKCLYPERIVTKKGNIENEQALLVEKAKQIGLMETNLVNVTGKGYIVLDFGKEISGGARILTFHTNNNCKIRLRFGESVAETMAELGFKNATNDHSDRDIVCDIQNYSDMSFGQTGFRFLRVDFVSDDTLLEIKSIMANDTTDDREQPGSFMSDDKLVNDIFNTASYTIRMCLQNGYFWDGVKRDRLVWIGDLYPEMRAANCIFGDVPETINSLDFAMDETPLPQWMAGMPSYTLWWLIILCEEYKINGEKEKFTKYLDYVVGVIKQVNEYIDDCGTPKYPFNFIDWPTQYEEGQPLQKVDENLAGMAYITKIAMTETALFLADFNVDNSLCYEIINRLDKKKWNIEMYKQISALAVLSGDKRECHHKLLVKGGAKGMSTFMSYPVLTAVADYGDYEKALTMMKDYYGGMLKVGATTFWEDFDLDWLENAGRIDELPSSDKVDIHGDYGAFCYKGFRHSFCHGWSAGIIAYLMETVAGLHFKGVGMTELEIRPHLSGLKHIHVNYPTKYGVVSVEHKLTANGNVETKFTAPKEIKVRKFID